MEKKENRLEEQQAPLKNTDKAFVKVGKSGEPVMPDTPQQKDEEEKKEDVRTSLDKR